MDSPALRGSSWIRGLDAAAVRALTVERRLLVMLAIALGYAALLALLAPWLGPVAASLAAIPLAIAGWLFGWRGGLTAAATSAVVTTLILDVTLHRSFIDGALAGWFGMLMGVAVGVAAGAISDSLVARDRQAVRMGLIEAQLREFAQAVSEAFVLSEADGGRPLYVSPGYERIFGQPAKALVEHPMSFVTSVVEEDRATLLERLTVGAYTAGAEVEYRIMHPTRGRRWLRTQVFPIRDARGRVVRLASVTEDVTDRHLAEAARRESLERVLEVKRLEETNQFRAQFFNNAAHELATPLTPIRLELHVLRSPALGPLTPAQQHAFEVVERNLSRFGTLVTDLLEAARIQNGRLKLGREPTNVTSLVEDAVESFGESARQAGVTLSVAATPGLSASLDPRRVSQVMFNFLSNSLKFTPSGGSIRVVAGRDANGIVVRVGDSGVGLTPEQMSRLFLPFSQVHEAQRGGNGLGLYISKSIVEAHGGLVWVESDGPGCGSEFGFSVPTAPTTLGAPLATVAA